MASLWSCKPSCKCVCLLSLFAVCMWYICMCVCMSSPCLHKRDRHRSDRFDPFDIVTRATRQASRVRAIARPRVVHPRALTAAEAPDVTVSANFRASSDSFSSSSSSPPSLLYFVKNIRKGFCEIYRAGTPFETRRSRSAPTVTRVSTFAFRKPLRGLRFREVRSGRNGDEAE